MSEVDRLKELKEEIKRNEANISDTNKAISKLYLDEKVMRYISLQDELVKLTNENEKAKKKALELTQEMCNHRLLFFASLYKERLLYEPSFMCLECAKQIRGFMNDEQICVNEDYITENDYGIFGDSIQFGEFHQKYENLQDTGLSFDEIKDKITSELKRKNNSGDSAIKLVLRKK